MKSSEDWFKIEFVSANIICRDNGKEVIRVVVEVTLHKHKITGGETVNRAFAHFKSFLDTKVLKDARELGTALLKEWPAYAEENQISLPKIFQNMFPGTNGKIFSDFQNTTQIGEYVDMLKSGIVDPVKVTRSALQNASSIAGLLLTTEVLITDIPEKKEPMPPMPGGGGMGMPGMM